MQFAKACPYRPDRHLEIMPWQCCTDWPQNRRWHEQNFPRRSTCIPIDQQETHRRDILNGRPWRSSPPDRARRRRRGYTGWRPPARDQDDERQYSRPRGYPSRGQSKQPALGPDRQATPSCRRRFPPGRSPHACWARTTGRSRACPVQYNESQWPPGPAADVAN